MLKVARSGGRLRRRRRAAAVGKSCFGKKQIRDEIRAGMNGEREWRKLQAAVYGPRIGEAQLISGVRAFFKACRKRGIPVYVISHKTKFAAEDESHTNLRVAALRWMDRNGFFAPRGFGLLKRHVFFESTRKRKLKRISKLRCTHFIDDLEETFLERDFPKGVEKILYNPHARATQATLAQNRLTARRVRLLRSWSEIRNCIFRGLKRI